MSNNFNIAGENDPNGNGKSDKKNKTIAISIVSVMLVAAAGTAIFVSNNSNKKPDDYVQYEEKAEIYKKQGIEYSYEDYKQDKVALEEQQKENSTSEIGTSEDSNITDISSASSTTLTDQSNMSEATKQLINKTENFLDELEKDTMIDTSLNQIANSIIDQTKAMNDFIKNHLGYPDSEFGEEYDGVKAYMDELVKSMYGESNPETMYDIPLSQIQAEIRYSIVENIRYSIGNNYKQYNESLSQWMSIGHPTIDSIETISLEKPKEEKMYDDVYLCNLEATIISKGIKYKIYLSSQIIDDGGSLYKILDIQKV